MFKRLIMWFKGVLWQSEDGSILVTKQGWVIATDGVSTDAMPISLCSEAFLQRVLGAVGEKEFVRMVQKAPSIF